MVPGPLVAGTHIRAEHAVGDRAQGGRIHACHQGLAGIGKRPHLRAHHRGPVDAHLHAAIELVAGHRPADAAGRIEADLVATANRAVGRQVLGHQRQGVGAQDRGVLQQRRGGRAGTVAGAAAHRAHAGAVQRQQTQAGHAERGAIDTGFDGVGQGVALAATGGRRDAAIDAAAGTVAGIGADLHGGSGHAGAGVHARPAGAVTGIGQHRALQADLAVGRAAALAGAQRGRGQHLLELRGAGGLHQHLQGAGSTGAADHHLGVAAQTGFAALDRVQLQQALAGAADLDHQAHVGVGGQHQAGRSDRALGAHHGHGFGPRLQRHVGLVAGLRDPQVDVRAGRQPGLAAGDQRAQHVDAGAQRGLGRPRGLLDRAGHGREHHIATRPHGLALEQLDLLGLDRQAGAAEVGLVEDDAVDTAQTTDAQQPGRLGEDQVVQAVAGDAHPPVGLHADAGLVAAGAQVQHQVEHLLVQHQQVLIAGGRAQQRAVLLRPAAEVDHRRTLHHRRQRRCGRALCRRLQRYLRGRHRQHAVGRQLLAQDRVGRQQHAVFQPLDAGPAALVAGVARLQGLEAVLGGLVHGAQSRSEAETEAGATAEAGCLCIAC